MVFGRKPRTKPRSGCRTKVRAFALSMFLGVLTVIRDRELARKSKNDPLTSIQQQLSRRPSESARPRPMTRRLPPPAGVAQEPQVSERLSRESAERQRAQELIRRRRREMAGSETPSTVHGGMDGGYGDVFNRREVEEAHRQRDRDWRDRDGRRHGDSRLWSNGR